MKIALSFPACHRRGGVERVLVESANHLAGRGHDVHVFSGAFDDKVLAPAVQQQEVSMRPVPGPLRAWAFKKACRAAMNHAGQTFDAVGGFGALTPPGGVAWAQSVHAAWLRISRSQQGLRDGVRQRLNPFHPIILRMERDLYAQRRYAHVLALTDQVKADLMRHYAVPESDITVLPNGYRPEEFNPARRLALRDSVREELALQPGAAAVVFVANEPHRKGLWPLMRAIARMADRRPALVVVGRLDGRAVRGFAQALGIADRVRIIGPADDVARYYAGCDVFALPTQYEAWGLVIVEALANGLPVLTSRCAGAAVAVDEGRTGQLLDQPRDEVEIARKLSLLLDRLPTAPQAVSESVQEYAWGRILGQYEDVLERYGSVNQENLCAPSC